jgi:hypothetical protein
MMTVGWEWCVERPSSDSRFLESRRKLDVTRPLEMLLPIAKAFFTMFLKKIRFLKKYKKGHLHV